MTEPITLLSTSWCGHCRRLKRQLDEAGLRYIEIDLDQDKRYDARIIEATGGFRTVPTVEVGGELLVNPTVDQVVTTLRGVSHLS